MHEKDLRFVKTEKAIRSAFFESVRTNGYEKTNVAELCRIAMINRKTFYAHYTDKADLLGRLCDELGRAFQSAYDQRIEAAVREKDTLPVARWCLNTVIENRELYQAIEDCAPRRLESVLLEKIVLMPMGKLLPGFAEMYRRDLAARLHITYSVAGLIGYTNLWLEHREEIPYETAVKELAFMISRPPGNIWESPAPSAGP